MSARHGVPQGTADQSARQLDQVMRQLVSVINEQTAVARAALDQFYSLADLAKRWNCSPAQALKHLADHVGYVAQPGVKDSISLADVLRVDAGLLDSYEARKRVLAARAGSRAGREVAHAS